MGELLHQTSEVTPAAEQVSSIPVLTPAVDIIENEKELVLIADLPGVRQEDLSIKLENDLLTIEGLSSSQECANLEPLLAEFEFGRYFRQFTLGQSIDRAGIVARLKGGELVLTLPKAAAVQPQRINISAD